MRIFDFINDRSGRVTLTAIEAPKTEWKSPLEAFEDAYKHEQKITGMINDLMNLVAVEKDGAGHDFLEWFCPRAGRGGGRGPIDRRPIEAGRRQRRRAVHDRPATRPATRPK